MSHREPPGSSALPVEEAWCWGDVKLSLEHAGQKGGSGMVVGFSGTIMGPDVHTEAPGVT